MLSIGSNPYHTAQTTIRSQLTIKIPGQPTASDDPTVSIDSISVAPKVRDLSRIERPETDVNTFLAMFNKIDANDDRRVTKEEFLEHMKSENQPQEKIDRLLAQFFSPTTDLDGDGLSFQEAMRQVKINQGDAFAFGDLNSDNQITAEELQSFFKIYQDNGTPLDEATLTRIFNAADSNQDQLLTRAEYDRFDLPGKLAGDKEKAPEITAEYILNRLGGGEGNYAAFDLNNDTQISTRELEKVIDILSKHVEGFNGDRLRKIFSAKDGNSDGILTAAEFRGEKADEAPNMTLQGVFKRLGLEPGDRFGLFDLNKDEQITLRELGKALSAYSKYVEGFNGSAAQRLFNAADADGDGILTKREYAAFKNRDTSGADVVRGDTAISRPLADKVPADNITTQPKIAFDATSVKQQLAPSGLTIDTQLLLLLQEQA